ncbi:MAG: hypothetical protein ITG05_02885 [Pseudomonas stutzeri]|nr:hypothetical protein [Stutzerimonas stutzeri]
MNDEIPDAVIYIYGILNMVIMAARVVSIGAAIWVAFKPDGSVLAGLIIFYISTFMTPVVHVTGDKNKRR